MSVDFGFQEAFLNGLDLLRQDVDRALIFTVHVIFSSGLKPEQKQKVCDDLAALGKELNAHIAAFNLKELTPYTVREKEESFVRGAKALHAGFESFLDKIDKGLGVRVDRNMLFSIADVVEKLGGERLHAEYGFTKDKIDNLLSIKNLIVGIHRSQNESEAEKERSLDRQFTLLKERTFSESVRSPGNVNALYYFKSVELLKKFLREGAATTIVNDDRNLNGNEIGFRIRGEQRIVVEYSFSGRVIEIDLRKGRDATEASYGMAGRLEIGSADIEFKIEEKVSLTSSVGFERVTGIDFLWAQFEKAYIDFQTERQELGAKQERLNRNILDKAIDDLLFKD